MWFRSTHPFGKQSRWDRSQFLDDRDAPQRLEWPGPLAAAVLRIESAAAGSRLILLLGVWLVALVLTFGPGAPRKLPRGGYPLIVQDLEWVAALVFLVPFLLYWLRVYFRSRCQFDVSPSMPAGKPERRRILRDLHQADLGYWLTAAIGFLVVAALTLLAPPVGLVLGPVFALYLLTCVTPSVAPSWRYRHDWWLAGGTRLVIALGAVIGGLALAAFGLSFSPPFHALLAAHGALPVANGDFTGNGLVGDAVNRVAYFVYQVIGITFDGMPANPTGALFFSGLLGFEHQDPAVASAALHALFGFACGWSLAWVGFTWLLRVVKRLLHRLPRTAYETANQPQSQAMSSPLGGG